MTVYELLNRLIQLPNGFGHYQIKVNIPCIRPGDEGAIDIETILIDQEGTSDPVILIEVKN